ncbi:MAG: ABC transporter permease [Opitutales bacterium]|nr:ABC transporter permease [Opitutales bacterium]
MSIYWIARNTFLEAVRQRFFNFLLILGLLMTALSLALSGFDFGGNELKFVADFGFGGLFLFGSILAVVMTVQLFFAEIDNRTAITLLAKPVSRFEFVVGKFAGIALLLAVFVALMALLLGIVLALRQPVLAAIAEQRGSLAPYFSLSGLALFAVLQWIRLLIVAAMTFFFTSFAQTYLYAVVVSFCGLLIAQLQYVLQDVAAGDKTGTFAKIAAGTIAQCVPNLQLFNLGPQLTLDAAGVPAGTVLAAAGYGCVWAGILIFLAFAFFRSREM